MKIPDSMKEELAGWNNGKGIDLETWVGCLGNFSLAVGYASIFCPNFIEIDDYLLRGDHLNDEILLRVRSFESQTERTAKSVEWVMNHIHIADIHHYGCEDLTVDKIIVLGEKLKSIYESRLAYLFPHKPCIVEFYRPDDVDDLHEYQLSFWQQKHEK